ncbi:hypothetical protein ACXZ1K_17230 [Pedobacter sp. PWIIR3]
MKRLLSIFLFFFTTGLTFGQQLDVKYQKSVGDFIALVKSNQLQKLVTSVRFPLKREYPLPAVKNKVDFIKRYKELFDDQLIKMITKSDLKNDWSAVGWRGIMLRNGSVWLDYDGKLIGINYQSDAEKLRRTKLINADKLLLHASLKNFKNPILEMHTSKFKIRIDEMDNGSYRYVSWPVKGETSSKPDLILQNGKFKPEGSGGNHSFQFTSGDYRYECAVQVLGEEKSPEAALTIYKNNKVILSQPASLINQ